MKQNGIIERLIEVLEKNPEGLTFSGIAKELGVHRHTATKYIYKMEGAGVVNVRDMGTLKLCYLDPEGVKKRDLMKLSGFLVRKDES